MDLNEFLEEKIRQAMQVISDAQEEKITALENKKKPDILLNRVGETNTNQAEEEAIVRNCDFLIHMAKVRIKAFEEVQDEYCSND